MWIFALSFCLGYDPLFDQNELCQCTIIAYLAESLSEVIVKC